MQLVSSWKYLPVHNLYGIMALFVQNNSPGSNTFDAWICLLNTLMISQKTPHVCAQKLDLMSFEN